MALFADDDDDGAPKRAKPGGVFTQKAGPLPVWGWAIVAVAGVFLWRTIAGGKKPAAETSDKSAAYPSGAAGVGGVFLIPSGAGYGSTPTTPPAGPVTSTVPAAVVAAADRQIAWAKGAADRQSPAEQQASLDRIAAANSPFLASLSQESAQVKDYFRDIAARRSAGLPYFAAGAGNTMLLVNPATGAALTVADSTGYTAQFRALTEDQKAGLGAGYAPSWAAITPGAAA